MGTRRDPGFGLVIIDDRISPDTLVVRGAGAQESAYTEDGPEPGHPENTDATSRWRPHVVGAQSVSLTARTLRGGYPGRDGASICYRLATDTDNADYRGWSEPNLLANITAPTAGWGAAAAWESVTCAVHPDTGLIVVTAVSLADAAQTWTYNPRTEAWADGFAWPDGLKSPIGMAWDPVSRRFLLWSGPGGESDDYGFQSSDNGTTWTPYTRFAFENDTVQNQTTGVTRFATQLNNDWLAIWVVSPNGATGDSTQWASSDQGVTWDLIFAGAANDAQNTLFPVATKDGGYLVLGLDTTGRPKAWKLPSPRTPIDEVTAIALTSDSTIDADNIWAVVDDDGTVYVWTAGVRTPSANRGGEFRFYRSTDHGVSWELYRFEHMSFLSVTSIAPAWHAGVASGGQCHFVGTITDSSPHADLDGTIHLASFGGWGQLEQGIGGAGNPRERRGRFGFGRFDADSAEAAGKVWVPYETPVNMGWIHVGAGTRDLDPSEAACIELTCTALGQDASHTSATPNAAAASGVCMAIQYIVKAASDQGNLATIPAGGRGINVQGILSDGAASWIGTVVCGKDGIRVENAAGTSLGTAAVTMTEWTTIRVSIYEARISVWYRQRGTGTTWTQVVLEATLTAGVLTDSDIEWGLFPGVAGTEAAHGFVRMVGFTTRADWRVGLEANDIEQNAETEILGLMFGHTAPGTGAAYPIPDLTTTSEDLGHIRASGGPTYFGELVTLPEAYAYPVTAVHPDTSPSPRVQWRSTGLAETELVYDLGENVFLGGALALAVINATPRSFELSIDDGAGGWSVVGTLDKGWSSINYTLSGRTIVPRSGTAVISRYIHENELVGGYATIQPFGVGANSGRRITRNSAGYWTTDANVQRVKIEVEGLDGTEPASGAGDIVAPSGVLVAYPSTDAIRQLVRVRIASAISPDERYEAGIIAVGRVMAAGAQPSWEWQRLTEFSREVTRRADGSAQIRRTGPPRRSLRYSWDPVTLLDLRVTANSPDYVGASGGVAIGTSEDVSTSLVGAVVEQLRSGEVPAIVIPKLPATTSTITDPTLWMYGVVTSDGWDVSGVVGEEGTNEVVRMGGGFTFEEIS
jgi:hypothetical protein